ncbi:MAG TPA: hypothetical protein VK179_06940 [Bacteroidales bacterium]|nr:hypothetical protein [Bacteroidales bacterium]
MKSLGFVNYARLLAGISLVIFSFNSCKKDDDNNNNDPAYVGTWSRTDTIPVDTFALQVKDLLTFTKTTVTNMGQIYNPDTDEWLDLMGMKGTFTASGKTLDITVDQVGISDFDTLGIPSGNIQYFTKDDAEFNLVLNELDQKENFQAEYNVSGNKLTMKVDDNDDGDFTDDGETQVYTKESGSGM